MRQCADDLLGSSGVGHCWDCQTLCLMRDVRNSSPDQYSVNLWAILPCPSSAPDDHRRAGKGLEVDRTTII